MRITGLQMERVLEHLAVTERLLEHMERHQTKKHVRNAVKEWLLVSRSVIDSFIDSLEEESTLQTARKIDISNE
ncbi:hypothetical protein [Paenibacillus terrigena]|uniref:hypothetical protein n=1 Tax=Paenibacillus terrigena TaxID=369333 RepID=UPI0028D6D7CE|nr:hypothetical protein [Paenibacillus terrigena]